MTTKEKFISNLEASLEEMADYDRVQISYSVRKQKDEISVHFYDDTKDKSFFNSLGKSIQFRPKVLFKIQCEDINFDVKKVIEEWLKSSLIWENATPRWWDLLFPCLVNEIIAKKKKLWKWSSQQWWNSLLDQRLCLLIIMK